MKVLWKCCNIFVFLDFFFNIVKLGEPKFTVSYTIFLCYLFVCLFLMYYFKTSNNFSPKICYKNIVDVKNKIIISNWDLPQLGIKKFAKMLWHFVVFLGFFFCLVKFGKPKFIVLGTIFFNWHFILFF